MAHEQEQQRGERRQQSDVTVTLRFDREQFKELICLGRGILQQLGIAGQKADEIMALGQDILDEVTAQKTVIDSFIALVQKLVDDHTIPAATGAAIKSALSGNRAALETAILAHTPQEPPAPTP